MDDNPRWRRAAAPRLSLDLAQAEKAAAAEADARAAAAARRAKETREATDRCAACGGGLRGKLADHFEVSGRYYCSTKCVKVARGL